MVKLCAFNSLLPALYLNATVDHDLVIGATSPGPTAMFGPIRHGILRSEPGFPVNINAEIVHSGDLVTIDPDQKWLHNDFSGMLKTDSGEYLRFTMKAIEQPTQNIMRILGGDPTAPDVEHGDFYGVSSWNFITGSEKYKELENSVYVGSTRLSRGSEPDSFSIAFRISQVSHVPSTTDCVEVDDTIKHSEL